MKSGSSGPAKRYESLKELRVLFWEVALHLHTQNANAGSSPEWPCNLQGYTEVCPMQWWQHRVGSVSPWSCVAGVHRDADATCSVSALVGPSCVPVC